MQSVETIAGHDDRSRCFQVVEGCGGMTLHIAQKLLPIVHGPAPQIKVQVSPEGLASLHAVHQDAEDLWLVHDDTMDRLRAEPRFVAASQRVAEAGGIPDCADTCRDM